MYSISPSSGELPRQTAGFDSTHLHRQQSWLQVIARWWPVLLGLLVLYVPTFLDLGNTLWSDEEHAHGPLIFMVVLYLFWQQRSLLQAMPIQVDPVSSTLGTVSLVFGLFCYLLGRSQQIWLFETVSLPFVLSGIVLLTRGIAGIKSCWFALLFTLFLVPLPGALVDVATGPLKQWISSIAENLLYQVGYPIGRNGVMLVIGRYHLLVADACSGLRSMFSLASLGMLYLYVMQHRSRWRNALIMLSILPIAFIANLVRVLLLILITYHFGDEAGQGFLHGFTGIVLFVAALLCLLAFDRVLALAFKPRLSTKGAA